MSRLIVIEGLDGSGKATQAKMLAERLRCEEKEVFEISFPCYEDDSSVFVRMYLDGEFGENPEDVGCYAASMFYAADRYVSFKKNWGRDFGRDNYFVADRYVTSNAIYQTSKLQKSAWDEFLAWLEDFEYNKLGIPLPDKVIYLDVPPEEGERLMTLRYGGDMVKMDIHERNLEYQRKSREAALYCAERQHWAVINCGGDGKIRNRESIAEEIAYIAETVAPR